MIVMEATTDMINQMVKVKYDELTYNDFKNLYLNHVYNGPSDDQSVIEDYEAFCDEELTCHDSVNNIMGTCLGTMKRKDALERPWSSDKNLICGACYDEYDE